MLAANSMSCAAWFGESGPWKGKYTGRIYSTANWEPEKGDTLTVVMEKMRRDPDYIVDFHDRTTWYWTVDHSRNDITRAWYFIQFPPGTRGSFKIRAKIDPVTNDIYDVRSEEPRVIDCWSNPNAWDRGGLDLGHEFQHQ